MHVTTTSKIGAYMATVKALLEQRITGIGEVVLLGQRDVEAVIKAAAQKGGGQCVTMMAVGGENTQPNSRSGLEISTTFQISIYDSPNRRDHYARHGYELVEDIMRALQGQDYQEMPGQCSDTAIGSWFIEQDGGADIYTIPVTAKLKYTPITIT